MGVNIFCRIIKNKMIEYIQCRKCLNKNLSKKSGKPIAGPGYIVIQEKNPETGLLADKLIECECHKEWRLKSQLVVKAKRASLDPSLIDYNLRTDYLGTESLAEVNRVLKYVEMSLNPKERNDIKARLASSVIYLYGTNGTQKTHVGNWMGYEFLKKGKSVRFILMNTLIKLLQKADRDEDVQEQLDKLSDVDLLIIDEAFDKEKVTIYKSNFQFPYIDTFLRDRLQTKHKGIVFISNVSPYDIESKGFNASIQDLVIRNLAQCKGLMEFKDRYMDIASAPDSDNLF